MVLFFHIRHLSFVFPAQIIGVSRTENQIIPFTYVSKCRKSSTTRLHGWSSIAESWSPTWRPLWTKGRYVDPWMCSKNTLHPWSGPNWWIDIYSFLNYSLGTLCLIPHFKPQNLKLHKKNPILSKWLNCSEKCLTICFALENIVIGGLLQKVPNFHPSIQVLNSSTNSCVWL
jgi:hypothetical protein